MRVRKRLILVTTLTAAAWLSAAAGSAQFISYGDRSRSILEGTWQSCRESDGHYSERVYDNTLPGIGAFELHLGPYHEFALFRGVQDQHRPHESTANLLRPFNVEVLSNRARHSWDVAGLRLEVNLGGGSDEQCESWYLSLRRAGAPSSE
jgi:hypothetical protein